MRRSSAALAACAVFLAGCQRGCLARWLADHGLGGGDVTSTPQAPGGALGGHEPAPCPVGLARCSAGVVRVSTAYTPPAGCSPEGCKCPWEEAQRCAFGCTAENVEMDMAPALATLQLCAPAPGEDPRFARTLGAMELDAAATQAAGPPDAEVEAFCEVERYRCANGVVSVCDSGQATPFAACVHGCVEGEGLVVEQVSKEAAAALLCARTVTSP